MQGGREASLGSDELGELLNPLRYRLCRRVLSSQDWCCIGAGFDLVRHDSRDQIGSPWEVAVHRANAHACSIRDLLPGSVDPRFCEDGLGCLEQSIKISLRVNPKAPSGPSASWRAYLGRGCLLCCHVSSLAKAEGFSV